MHVLKRLLHFLGPVSVSGNASCQNNFQDERFVGRLSNTPDLNNTAFDASVKITEKRHDNLN